MLAIGAIENQLLAIRSQAASLVTQCDAALFMVQSAVVAEQAPSGCEHKNRLNMTTMGQPEQWKCRDCGLHYTAASLPGGS